MVLVPGNIWLPSPSVFRSCGRPISSERGGLWQGGLVTAAHSCNTDGAFHISAESKGNRSRSFSISTAHDVPTCWQRLKGERAELCPVVSWSCTADWPMTSFSKCQWEKGRNGWRRTLYVCYVFKKQTLLGHLWLFFFSRWSRCWCWERNFVTLTL